MQSPSPDNNRHACSHDGACRGVSRHTVRGAAGGGAETTASQAAAAVARHAASGHHPAGVSAEVPPAGQCLSRLAEDAEGPLSVSQETHCAAAQPERRLPLTQCIRACQW